MNYSEQEAEIILVNFDEYLSYKKRKQTEAKPTLIIVLLFFIVSAILSSSLIFPLIICTFMWCVYYSEIIKWSKIFIQKISVNPETKLMRIIYYERDEVFEKTIDLNKTTSGKKYVWYKVYGQQQFLTFSEDGDLIIKQYKSDQWTEKLIDETVKKIEDLKKTILIRPHLKS